MTTVDHSLTMATQLHQAGNFLDAEHIYRQILALDPTHAETLYLLGYMKTQMGEPEVAIQWLRRAIEVAPTNDVFHLAMGNAQYAAQIPLQAIESFRQAIRLNPESFEAFGNLGTALHNIGSYQEAIECCRRAVALRPDNAEAHYNLAMVLRHQGAHAAAIDCFQQSLALQPDFVDALLELGNTYGAMGAMRPAAETFQRAIELRPDLSEAYCSLGSTLQALDDLESAAAAYRKANQLQPGCADANLANVMQHLGQWEGLEPLAHRVIEDIDRHRTDTDSKACNPFGFVVLAIPTSAAQQLSCAKQFLKSTGIGSIRPMHWDRQNRRRDPRSKLRIGYLSSDFGVHATAWLIAELFECHDRQRFEIFGFSIGADDRSPIRHRIQAGLDHFLDIDPLSYSAAAAVIAQEKIDILVDLKGYTQHARTQIMASRPAPIQVNYLGYPGSMGADFIDYILVDDFIVPADQQPYFTERLVHLPGCYQVNDSQSRIAPRIPTRAECGLPSDSFVFCSFNDAYKLTPSMFDRWMRLLRARPASVLWLLESNRFSAANLRREASDRGVASERLIFAPRMPHPEHLARHCLADLFLDSFPVNAHTTASDALRMGLPIVTLAGQTFVSRVAGSLLRAVGLSDLIASSYEEYETIALRLSQQPDQLAVIRNRLADNLANGELYNGNAFARKIEMAYQTMWERWQQN